MKKIFCLLMVVSFFAFYGCPRNLGLPESPYGQGALLIGAYHDQVTIYESEIKWAENEDHIELLKRRLETFQLIDDTFDQIGMVVAAGGSIPEGLLRSTKLSLTELKRWLYTKHSLERTNAEIEAALVRGGVIPKLRSHGWESIVLLLIELVQAFSPMWDRLDAMDGMTPEQVMAQFQAEWTWKQGFDPHDLPTPGKIVLMFPVK